LPAEPRSGSGTIRDHLIRFSGREAPALITHEKTWSWPELFNQLVLRANALNSLFDPARPRHVGLLMDNSPEMALSVMSAGLGSHVAVGLNTTRRGDGLVADIRKADCQVIIVDPEHEPLLQGLDLDGMKVFTSGSKPWLELISSASPTLVETRVSEDTLFMLVFTSGTSGSPKAVRITHAKITGPGHKLNSRFELDSEDVRYITMPLFHSNALMAGWGMALVCGAPIALARKFSASRFLADVRDFNASYTSYVGKPLAYILATPEQPDDAENPLRIAFGNEASDRDIAEFSRRFDCKVVDGFGSSENAVVISRIEGTPPGALGMPAPDVAVYDSETGTECPRAIFKDGKVINLDDCVGELVNYRGSGEFAGYYNDDEATMMRMRNGIYWSGDLAYRDEEGWAYFAGRTSDWLRVDGENLAAAPIERILSRNPAIKEVAVYALPDPVAGDQLVAALTLRADLDPQTFTEFLTAQTDLGTKSWPSLVFVLDELPRTATNKIRKRDLQSAGIPERGSRWRRSPRSSDYQEY
jgi:fatty-acyl-CoA synthase